MSDQFDKKLVDRINSVFENFEDDSAENGWRELRKRYPEKSNRRILWWCSSAAAFLLLGLVWFDISDRKAENQVAVQRKPARTEVTPDRRAESTDLSAEQFEPVVSDSEETPVTEKSAKTFQSKPTQSATSAERIKSVDPAAPMEDVIEEQLNDNLIISALLAPKKR